MSTKPPKDPTDESENEGYNVPPSPVIASARATLAQARELPREAPSREQRDRPVPPAVRNYANEAYVDDMIDDSEQVYDLMDASAVQQTFRRPDQPPEENYFREFKAGSLVVIGQREKPSGEIVDVQVSEGQIEYEAFMHEPIVIRIHETKDKNEPPLVFVAVNGDGRWLPRDKNVRIPRKLVERLAQAQEMTFVTKDESDPSAEVMKRTVRRNAASYSFSVLHDPNPRGRRWLQRVTREGS